MQPAEPPSSQIQDLELAFASYAEFVEKTHDYLLDLSTLADEREAEARAAILQAKNDAEAEVKQIRLLAEEQILNAQKKAESALVEFEEQLRDQAKTAAETKVDPAIEAQQLLSRLQSEHEEQIAHLKHEMNVELAHLKNELALEREALKDEATLEIAEIKMLADQRVLEIKADYEQKLVMEHAPASSTTRPARKIIDRLPEKRALLIDDAEINRVLISHYVKGLPVKLDFAMSWDEAIRKSQGVQFDLVLVDDEHRDLSSQQRSETFVRESLQTSGRIVAFTIQEETPQFGFFIHRSQGRDGLVQALRTHLWG